MVLLRKQTVIGIDMQLLKSKPDGDSGGCTPEYNAQFAVSAIKRRPDAERCGGSRSRQRYCTTNVPGMSTGRTAPRERAAGFLRGSGSAVSALLIAPLTNKTVIVIGMQLLKSKPDGGFRRLHV